MKTVKCNCGRDIQVDDTDFDRVAEFQWCCKSGMHMRGVSDWTPLGSFILNHYHGIVDHIDRDCHNNQRLNLRRVTRAQNNRNASIRKDNLTGYKGVYFSDRERKYKAQIRVNGKAIHLGTFVLVEKAALAYNKAAQEHFGEFAVLNKIKNELTTTPVN